MSVSQASNTPPPSSNYEDVPSDVDPQQEELAIQDSPAGQENSYGNQPQNVTRDQIIQLYRKIQKLDRSDEKEILSTLDDALHLLADGNGSNDGQSAVEYEQVYQEVGGDKLMSSESGGQDCPVIDTSKDTEPDTKDGDTWLYSGYKNGDVSIHAVEGHDNKINVTGTAKITLNPGQTADVSQDSSDNSYVVTVKDQDQTITKITVSDSAQAINIDGPESAVTVGNLSNSDKLQIQGSPVSQTAQGVSSITDLLSGAENKVSDNLQFSWAPDVNIEDYFNNPDILKGLGDDGLYHYPYVNNFVSSGFHGISQGMDSGDWSGLKSAMDQLVSDVNADPSAKGSEGQWADANRLNGYHALFMGLYSVLGESKLHAVFNKMASDDPDLFNQFKDSFSALDGKGGKLNPTDKNRSDAPWASGAWSSEVGSWTDGDVQSFMGGGQGSSGTKSAQE